MEMKISEETWQEDWRLIKGKFSIELEKGVEYGHDFIKERPDFWMEKRISFIASQPLREEEKDDYRTFYLFNGLCYNGKARTKKEFIDKWNGKGDSKRYIRLMKRDGLRQLFDHMMNNSF